jgi:hypothetical protein
VSSLWAAIAGMSVVAVTAAVGMVDARSRLAEQEQAIGTLADGYDLEASVRLLESQVRSLRADLAKAASRGDVDDVAARLIEIYEDTAAVRADVDELTGVLAEVSDTVAAHGDVDEERAEVAAGDAADAMSAIDELDRRAARLEADVADLLGRVTATTTSTAAETTTTVVEATSTTSPPATNTTTTTTAVGPVTEQWTGGAETSSGGRAVFAAFAVEWEWAGAPRRTGGCGDAVLDGGRTVRFFHQGAAGIRLRSVTATTVAVTVEAGDPSRLSGVPAGESTVTLPADIIASPGAGCVTVRFDTATG